jgi:hypothetical protein
VQPPHAETGLGPAGGEGPRNTPKKIFAVLGVGFLALAAWGLIGFGGLKLWRYGSQLAAESQAYVDDVIPKIVSSWDANALMERAAPELTSTASPEKFEKIFRVLSDRLGPLERYEGSRGRAHVSVTPQTGRVTVASYVAEATFQKGKASIELNLVMRDQGWQIVGFFVRSDALLP